MSTAPSPGRVFPACSVDAPVLMRSRADSAPLAEPPATSRTNLETFMSVTHIRLATVADLEAINRIYNYYVLTSTCTYQEEVEPLETRLVWFDRHGPEHPVTVAENAGAVVGWGALSPFHARSAYRRTVENAVYVDAQQRGLGFGRLLLADLIARAQSLGHHTIVGLVDSEQSASLALHTSLGFTRVGHLKEVYYKFDRWLDVVYMQLLLSSFT